MVQKILLVAALTASISARAVAPVELGSVRTVVTINSFAPEATCWRVSAEAEQLVQELSGFSPLVSCFETHRGHFELDLVIDRWFEVEQSELEAEWLSFYNSQQGLCQIRASLIDQLTPVLALRNLSLGQFCQGESGSVIVTGESLRLVGR
jgi:hypothetical protein